MSRLFAQSWLTEQQPFLPRRGFPSGSTPTEHAVALANPSSHPTASVIVMSIHSAVNASYPMHSCPIPNVPFIRSHVPFRISHIPRPQVPKPLTSPPTPPHPTHHSTILSSSPLRSLTNATNSSTTPGHAPSSLHQPRVPSSSVFCAKTSV